MTLREQVTQELGYNPHMMTADDRRLVNWVVAQREITTLRQAVAPNPITVRQINAL